MSFEIQHENLPPFIQDFCTVEGQTVTLRFEHPLAPDVKGNPIPNAPSQMVVNFNTVGPGLIRRHLKSFTDANSFDRLHGFIAELSGINGSLLDKLHVLDYSRVMSLAGWVAGKSLYGGMV